MSPINADGFTTRLRSIKENAAVSKTADDSSNLSEDTIHVKAGVTDLKVETDRGQFIDFVHLGFHFICPKTGKEYRGELRESVWNIMQEIDKMKPRQENEERTYIELYTKTP